MQAKKVCAHDLTLGVVRYLVLLGREVEMLDTADTVVVVYAFEYVALVSSESSHVEKRVASMPRIWSIS